MRAPEAAVQAATKALLKAWGYEATKDSSLSADIRIALEAAAPHIAAHELREASAAYPLETAYGGAEHAVQWLKARAEHIGKHHEQESETQ